MVVVCPVCGDSVHVSCGYILDHRSRKIGLIYERCSGSGSPYGVVNYSCCG